MSASELLNFDNQFIQHFSADPIKDVYSREVTNASYSFVSPKLTSAPKLVAASSDVAEMLQLSPEFVQSELFTNLFSGNEVLAGMQPYATLYGGHQFGHWAGQLGDGRAINLGEVVTKNHGRQALQLKGAGPTPYSRRADGLAVLRSSVREFLCSEAMHHLGVPTTRALSLCLTGDQVMRDMFYDGNAAYESGAVVCRVAPSFTRFGHFEIYAARGDKATLEKLIRFTIEYDYPHLDINAPDVYITWFKEICHRTAEMIVHWMRVGFVHGVMNTDNMSILGLTIDYGPYGWLENYDGDWTPNTTDAEGKRYGFANQPQIAAWNLTKLASAIQLIIDDSDALEQALAVYANTFNNNWLDMMSNKLGFSQFEKEHEKTLIYPLLSLLQSVETDMTVFYRQLAHVDLTANEVNIEQAIDTLMPAYYLPEQINPAYRTKLFDWLTEYQHAMSIVDTDRTQMMNNTNPKYVLRNYLAQIAIDDADKGDFSTIETLHTILKNPYDEQPEHEEIYAAKRPEWARHRAGCSQLSCSS